MSIAGVEEENIAIYILMMQSHCRVTTRAKSTVTVIARIGHVSNLTTHI